MCGILFSNDSKFNSKIFRVSLELINHRGPDNTGYFELENIKMGHKRLSIQDLSIRSNQPLQRGDNLIIFNGEVYNFLRLKKEHNLELKTSSDTEVILAMYEKYSENCLRYFNGMFSFVIFNIKTKETFIARDRLGVKPLYYAGDLSKNFSVSSEVAPLLKVYGNELNDFGLRQYKKLRMCIKGSTIYKSISQFPAGYFCRNGKLIKYWELDNSPKDDPKDEILEELIEDAVKLRSISDVEVGSYLSGGLDSTIISCILKPNQTWTVGFEKNNEFEWGNMVAQNIGTDHSERIVTYDEFINTIKLIVQKRKEPLSVPNEVLIYLMTLDVCKKNTVVLSGEGADELFWGYDRIFKKVHQDNKLDIKTFNDYYCYGSEPDDEVIDYALEGLLGYNSVQKLGYYFQVHHLSGLLRRLDSSTMLCSVEARTPFVDYRLVEMMAGTSFEWKVGDSFKVPLKRIYYNKIPKSIIDRSKVGFPVPLKEIFSSNKYIGNKPIDRWFNYNLNLLGIQNS